MASSKEIRNWLRMNGVAVGERGRIHPVALRKYEAAHAQTAVLEPVTIPESRRGMKYYPCGWCITGECEHCLTSFKDSYCKCAVNDHKENNGRALR